MKRLIRITESDLHNIVENTVKKVLKEGFWDNFSPDALDDKAYMDDYWDQRRKMMDDDWERRNIAIRKKYPGKSREWYEAMLDTFYESKMNGKTIKEDVGGATNAAGVMQTGCGNAPQGSNPEAGQYIVPFGKVQRRKIYSPKGDAKGDVTKQESNVDMTPAMKRKNGKGGSISIPKR